VRRLNDGIDGQNNLEQSARQHDISPVSVNLLSVSKDISVPGLVL